MSDLKKKKITGHDKRPGKKIQSAETKTSARIKRRYDTGVETTGLWALVTMIKMLRELTGKAAHAAKAGDVSRDEIHHGCFPLSACITGKRYEKRNRSEGFFFLRFFDVDHFLSLY